MKNSFKIAALALVIAASFAACKGTSEAGADSLKTTDSLSTDSLSTDSLKTDSLAGDTAKKM